MSHPLDDIVAKSPEDATVIVSRLSSLHADWTAFTASLRPDLREASHRLVHRIEIQKDVEICDWMDHFSPLTLLYANLQTQAGSIAERIRREADLAQLCLLIATFAEDRVADGQIEMDRHEKRFIAAVYSRASCILRSLTNIAPTAGAWIEKLSRAYSTAIHQTYTRDSTTVRYGTVRKVATARGYRGLLVPVALGACCGADDATLRRVVVAFDSLMLGLQWLDDLMDWREDLNTGDINLLIDLLRTRGLDARSHPASHTREPNVSFALLDLGILELAERHSIRWLRIAARQQLKLQCQVLANLIESRIDLVRRRGERERSRALRSVIDCSVNSLLNVGP